MKFVGKSRNLGKNYHENFEQIDWLSKITRQCFQKANKWPNVCPPSPRASDVNKTGPFVDNVNAFNWLINYHRFAKASLSENKKKQYNLDAGVVQWRDGYLRCRFTSHTRRKVEIAQNVYHSNSSGMFRSFCSRHVRISCKTFPGVVLFSLRMNFKYMNEWMNDFKIDSSLATAFVNPSSTTSAYQLHKTLYQLMKRDADRRKQKLRMND